MTETAIVIPSEQCKHQPISNGWSGGWTSGGPTFWCGLCKARVRASHAWADMYYDRHLGYRRHDPDYAAIAVSFERDRALLHRLIDGEQ